MSRTGHWAAKDNTALLTQTCKLFVAQGKGRPPPPFAIYRGQVQFTWRWKTGFLSAAE
jgi:hypothetical protein